MEWILVYIVGLGRIEVFGFYEANWSSFMLLVHHLVNECCEWKSISAYVALYQYPNICLCYALSLSA